MKRTKIIITFLFISLIPCSLALSQESKNEQKVKVIIADKSGSKVIIDTTFAGTGKIDSVILKDGHVIYITKDKPDGSDKQVKVIARIDKDGTNAEHKYVYVNDMDDDDNFDTDKDVFDIRVSQDQLDQNIDKTRFVIAKNGITVSIEGTDEKRVKELADEIEKKLDTKGNDSKQDVKETGKETVKKK